MQQVFLGIDLGSSSVKASLVSATGQVLASAQEPQREMAIDSPHPGWAEQSPEQWWQFTCQAIRAVLKMTESKVVVKGIGIAYQMHGLVCLDGLGQVVRPAIIWCDGRAVTTGDQISQRMGRSWCQQHLLNQPGNFTLAKMLWVKENEPYTFRRITHVMLPGDFLAFKLTGRRTTTATGLSEATLWDFPVNALAVDVLQACGIPAELLPEQVPAIGFQGEVSPQAAVECGLTAGTPLLYRGGDQPNNAAALQVMEPGEFATTAGTSGVIYGVTDHLVADPESRINSFLHVSATLEKPRIGVLMCMNGTGILYSWLRRLLRLEYEELNALASQVKDSDGLMVLPFGNGPERILGNRVPTSIWSGLDFNRHSTPQVVRAALEGILFSFRYGLAIFHSLGMKPNVIRAGNANLFKSKVFCELFATILKTRLVLLDTDGAAGAARMAAGLQTPIQPLAQYEPVAEDANRYDELYSKWCDLLSKNL